MHLLKADAILRCQELLHHKPQSMVELIHQNLSPPLQTDCPIPRIAHPHSRPPGSQPWRHAKLPPSPPRNTITPYHQGQAAHQPVVQHHCGAEIDELGVPQSPHRGEPGNKRDCHIGHNSNILTGPHLLHRMRTQIEVTTVGDVEHYHNCQVHAIGKGQGVQLEAPTANAFRMSCSIDSRGQRVRTDNVSRSKAKVARERRGQRHQI